MLPPPEEDPSTSATPAAPDPAPLAPAAAPDDDARERRWTMRQIGTFGTIGIEFGVATAIGLLFGRWLDGHFDTRPWLMIIFALFGICAAFIDLFRLLGRAQKEP